MYRVRLALHPGCVAPHLCALQQVMEVRSGFSFPIYNTGITTLTPLGFVMIKWINICKILRNSKHFYFQLVFFFFTANFTLAVTHNLPLAIYVTQKETLHFSETLSFLSLR